MKKIITTFLIALLIIPCVLGFSACTLFGGNNGGGSGSGNSAETTMDITGDIPFNLENDFYFSVEMKPINNAMNPKSATFTAIRINNDDGNGGTVSSIYANYTYYVYKNFSNYQSGIYKEKYVEERTLYEGVNFRKSLAEKTNASDSLYSVYTPEEWNTKVPANTTMSTTIMYIQNFINGNHTADIPFQNEVAQTTLIPSLLSTEIHKKDVGIPSGSTEFYVYSNGTESMTFDRFENASTVYNEEKYSANITKYKDVFYENVVANVKVWGNIVVFSTPVQGQTLLKRTISTKFSTEITQETFEAIITDCGFTDPVL